MEQHHIPVYMGNEVVGFGHMTDDFMSILVSNEKMLKAVQQLPPVGNMRSFNLSICYTPIETALSEKEEQKQTPEAWMYTLRKVWNYEDRDGRENEKMTKGQFLGYMTDLAMRGCCAEVAVPPEAWGTDVSK